MKYFTIEELTRSSVAQTRRIENKPDAVQQSSLVDLTENVLDPLREKFGKPILVSSGFRSKDLNRAVGNVEVRADGFSMSVGSIPNKTVEQVGEMVKAMFASLTA
ncbi:MAG: peptidase M15 [Chloroflexi bacterium]|nr:peptidase M15 [Chloroflexota bacterium]